MNKRTGFTLIEMLVAMTLTLFIMVIITTSFLHGLETFRRLKGIGDMNENLRLASNRIGADLRAKHFEGNRHLGDLAFPSQGKVRSGFFRIVQPTALNASANYVFEGVDLDGLPSSRAVDHLLHFSINYRGDRPQDFLYTPVPSGAPYVATDPKPFDPASPFFKPTTFFGQPPDASYQQGSVYTSQWAEVSYFLILTGWTTDSENPAANAGIPLFSLYRVERLVVPRSDQLVGVVPAGQLGTYGKFSCQPDATATALVFNAPEDLAAGQRSFATPASPTASLGASVLLSNVVSFQVQISLAGEAFHDLPVPAPPPAAPPVIFDTALQGNAPQRLAVIQITVRLWDPTSLQTRQVTIVQDM